MLKLDSMIFDLQSVQALFAIERVAPMNSSCQGLSILNLQQTFRSARNTPVLVNYSQHYTEILSIFW